MEHRRIHVPQSAASIADACEERSAPRFTLLIRSAKLVAPTGELICVIRDVSESGVSLRGFHALPVGEPLFLELQTGERHEIAPVWARGHEAGFRFVESVDVAGLVAEVGCFPKRQLRLGMAFPIELMFLGRRIAAEILNVSQQGARVACTEILAIDQPVRMASANFPEVRARVRWRRNGECGVVFDDTFTLAQLAIFAAQLQQPDLLTDPECASAARR
jgi:hypothetical protein